MDISKFRGSSGPELAFNQACMVSRAGSPESRRAISTSGSGRCGAADIGFRSTSAATSGRGRSEEAYALAAQNHPFSLKYTAGAKALAAITASPNG